MKPLPPAERAAKGELLKLAKARQYKINFDGESYLIVATDGFVFTENDSHGYYFREDDWVYTLDAIKGGVRVCDAENGEACDDCYDAFVKRFGDEADAVITLLQDMYSNRYILADVYKPDQCPGLPR